MNQTNTKGPHVGVLSMQRVINYGSFLQAYALRQLLLRNGAQTVSFIDIKPGRILPNTLFRPFVRAGKLVRMIFTGRLRQRCRTTRLVNGLRKSITSSWSMLRLDNPERTKFDLLVIGSDEVFNCCQDDGAGYTTQLFGDIKPEVAPRVISYAASFGHSTLSMLKEYGVEKEIGKNLKKLEALSVRDVNTKEIVESLTECPVQLHLDPVLIYGYKEEIAAFTEPTSDEPYMVVYTYPERIKSKREKNAIRDYARKRGLKIYCIFCDYIWGDKLVIPETPIDILRWFRNAECIVTDTFHGAIFSVITHSRFAAFVRESNRNKMTSLLECVGLAERSVMDMKRLDDVLDSEANYGEVEILLEKERLAANAYILNHLVEN